MTICGYHPRMGEGIAEFAEGLILSLSEKAKRNGQSVSVRLESEEDEVAILTAYFDKMAGMEEEFSQLKLTSEAFVGIVGIAKYLMDFSKEPPKDIDELGSRIRSRATHLADVLDAYEAAYEQAPSTSASGRTRHAYQRVFGSMQNE